MEVLRTITKPLSDEDIRDILGPECKIMKYSDLAEYSVLGDLLPKLEGYAIMLYEQDARAMPSCSMRKMKTLAIGSGS